jgi:hypothetical protein
MFLKWLWPFFDTYHLLRPHPSNIYVHKKNNQAKTIQEVNLNG